MGKNNNNSNKQIIGDSHTIKSADYVNKSNDDKNVYVYSDSDDTDDSDDYDDSDIQQLPQSDAPTMGSISTDHIVDGNMKSRPDAVYFVVAVIGGAKIWARTLVQTLIDMGPPFSDSLGSPLKPIYVDLPTNGR